MPLLPSALIFINGDISYPTGTSPSEPFYLGEDPNLFIGSSPSGGPDPNLSTLNSLQIQLFLTDIITYDEFINRMKIDPNYNTILHLQNLRVLVIVPSFQQLRHHDHFFHDELEINDGYCLNFSDGYRHDLADIIMFYHQGLIDIEFNRLGPRQSFDAQRITLHQLINAAKHNHGECNLPFDFPGFGGCCDRCDSRFFCDHCHSFSGIKICNNCSCDCKCLCSFPSTIHLPNCDREMCNIPFINRKS